MPGPLFEGNPVGEGTTRRGTATPVHRPQRPAPGESQGRGSLVGRRLWGHTESDTTEVTYPGDLPNPGIEPRSQKR